MLADNLFELKNGCICCTVKDDLVTTLEALLQRRNKFDYVIIETTGLANPVSATKDALRRLGENEVTRGANKQPPLS